MAQEIPLTDDVRQRFRTSLNDQSVQITVWWQPLGSSWFISLAWLDGRSIITGARLTEYGQPLAGVLTDFRGQLFMDGPRDPGRDAWRSGRKLYFLSDGE